MAKKRTLRKILQRVLAVLLVTLLIGVALFAAFQEKIEHWEYPIEYPEYVTYYADKYSIDPLMLYAFIRTESNFNPKAESDAGARGLMQILSVTVYCATMRILPLQQRLITVEWGR